MADYNYFKRASSGAILITALLFLLVITLLAISMLQTSLLESKMSANYHAKILSFKNAELNLQEKERRLEPSEIIATACGVIFYRVQATGIYKTAQTKLQSTFAVVNRSAHCHPKPNIHPGRQSWREL